MEIWIANEQEVLAAQQNRKGWFRGFLLKKKQAPHRVQFSVFLKSDNWQSDLSTMMGISYSMSSF